MTLVKFEVLSVILVEVCRLHRPCGACSGSSVPSWGRGDMGTVPGWLLAPSAPREQHGGWDLGAAVGNGTPWEKNVSNRSFTKDSLDYFFVLVWVFFLQLFWASSQKGIPMSNS